MIRSATDVLPSQYPPDPYPPDHSPPRPADADLELRSGWIFKIEQEIVNFFRLTQCESSFFVYLEQHEQWSRLGYFLSKPNNWTNGKLTTGHLLLVVLDCRSDRKVNIVMNFCLHRNSTFRQKKWLKEDFFWRKGIYKT